MTYDKLVILGRLDRSVGGKLAAVGCDSEAGRRGIRVGEQHTSAPIKLPSQAPYSD